MAEFDKGVPTNDDDQVAIVGGPGSASGGAGAPVPGGALGHYHNPEEEEIGLVLGDGYANKSVDESDGEDRATIRDMKRDVAALTTSQDEMSRQLGLLIGAMAIRENELPQVSEPTIPRRQMPGFSRASARRAFVSDDAGELTDVQEQLEQIRSARGIAKCTESLQGFDRTPMTVPSGEGDIRTVMGVIQDTATACRMEALLLPQAETYQEYAFQILYKQDEASMGMPEPDVLGYGKRVSEGSTTSADDRSPLHIAVRKHVGVGNTLLSLRLKDLAQRGSGPGYELLKETTEQVRMEQQAGVVVHYGYEVLRRMGEALSQDRDGNTAILRSASTFLKTPLKFHNGTYAATLLKATSEARSILHKLNASGCEHEFRVALLQFVRQSLPDEFKLLVNAGEVAIASVNPGDCAPSVENRAAYIAYWNKKIEVTLERWKKVAADLDLSWNTSAAARAAAAGAQAKAQASIKPKTVTFKPSPPKRMGMAALGGGATLSGTGGGRGTSLCLGCGENHNISECKTTTFVPGFDGNVIKPVQCWKCHKFGHMKHNCPGSTAHPNGFAPTVEGGEAC